jgi:hypothetical protein
VYAPLTILLLTAVVGCGTRQAEQAKGKSPPKETVVANGRDPATHGSTSRGARAIHLVSLSDRNCIRFEPQWTEVRLGQSLTWRSNLKSAVRIYLSPGVFSRDNFLVRPGATVSTGPAKASGQYSFWTEPAACRDAPRGVLLAGPGVRVQETFYASAPGVR